MDCCKKQQRSLRKCHDGNATVSQLLPDVKNKSMLPLFMFSFTAVLTLKLLLEMGEQKLRVACS